MKAPTETRSLLWSAGKSGRCLEMMKRSTEKRHLLKKAPEQAPGVSSATAEHRGHLVTKARSSVATGRASNKQARQHGPTEPSPWQVAGGSPVRPRHRHFDKMTSDPKVQGTFPLTGQSSLNRPLPALRCVTFPKCLLRHIVREVAYRTGTAAGHGRNEETVNKVD